MIWLSVVLVCCHLGWTYSEEDHYSIVLDPQPIRSMFSVMDEFGKNSLNNQNAYIFEYKQGHRIPGDELLLADTKSWRFPKQDVSLKISYPGESLLNDSFYVTEFRVFISQDSSESKGLLTSGGPGHHHMDLKFTAPQANYFTFDLRLFGISTDLVMDPEDVFLNIISDPNHLEWQPISPGDEP